jgi:hypothetical protein
MLSFAVTNPESNKIVRSMILAGTAELRTSRIRAMWTAISSPLIRSLFKSTWLAKGANHVDSSWGAEI